MVPYIYMSRNSDDCNYLFSRQQLEKLLTNSHSFPKIYQDFWDKVAMLYDGNVSKHALYKYITARINKLNLHNIDSNDVLTESILRGIDYITKYQKPIDNPTAWLRVTASNMLLEKVREIKRWYQWDENLDNVDLDRDSEDIDYLSENPSEAVQAFRSLSKSEQRIIIYRIFHHKKYSEIVELAYYRQYSESAVRKQYSRAITNLRKKFKELVPDFLL
jgi:RNA polymerase sigma factor (sigma-70 family)